MIESDTISTGQSDQAFVCVKQRNIGKKVSSSILSVLQESLLQVVRVRPRDDNLEVGRDIRAGVWPTPLTSVGCDLGGSNSLRKERTLDVSVRGWVWATGSGVEGRIAFKEDIERAATVGVGAVVGTCLWVVRVEKVIGHIVLVLFNGFRSSREGNEVARGVGGCDCGTVEAGVGNECSGGVSPGCNVDTGGLGSASGVDIGCCGSCNLDSSGSRLRDCCYKRNENGGKTHDSNEYRLIGTERFRLFISSAMSLRNADG